MGLMGQNVKTKEICEMYTLKDPDMNHNTSPFIF